MAHLGQHVGGDVGAQRHQLARRVQQCGIRQLRIVLAVQQVDRHLLWRMLRPVGIRAAEGQHAPRQLLLLLQRLQRQDRTLREPAQRHTLPAHLQLRRPAAHQRDQLGHRRRQARRLGRVVALLGIPLESRPAARDGVERLEALGQHQRRARVLAMQRLGQRAHLLGVGAGTVQQHEQQVGRSVLGDQHMGLGHGARLSVRGRRCVPARPECPRRSWA